MLAGWVLVVINLCFVNKISSLYTSEDDVTITTGHQLLKIIDEGAKDYLVEYYHRFCGHCIKFAPHFKKFATSIKDWKGLLEVLVLDCAKRNNTYACSESNVDGYPAIRYYPKDYRKIRTPYVLKHDDSKEPDVDELVSLVANYSPNVVLQPIENRERRWTLPNRYMLLQGFPKEWSVKTILYFSRRSIIPVVWTNQSLPTAQAAVVTLIDKSDKTGKTQIINASSWSEFYKNFKEVLLRWDLWTSASKKQQNSSQKSSEFSNLVDHLFKTVGNGPDKVHTSDLYSVLSRIFYNEIPLRIYRYDQEKMHVLKQFLSLLIQYFDGTETILNSLRYILNAINKSKITAKDWPEILTEAKFPEFVDRWITCAGSQPYFRGYPCGLWTLFHSLTVAEWKLSKRGAPPQVLPVMRDFILNFFSCKDCAMHFKALSANLREELSDARSSVLWLWRAHNNVNRRLAREPSEDPLHPKVQFPPPETCLSCQTSSSSADIQWDENEVFNYLLRRYDSGSWVRDKNVPKQHDSRSNTSQ